MSLSPLNTTISIRSHEISSHAYYLLVLHIPYFLAIPLGRPTRSTVAFCFLTADDHFFFLLIACRRHADRLAVEIVRAAVDPVRVRNRVPAGLGTDPVVHQHRTAAGGPGRRQRAVRDGGLLVGRVVRRRQIVQGVRRTGPGGALVLVRRVLRRRAGVRVRVRAGDQRQEPRTNPRGTRRQRSRRTSKEPSRRRSPCLGHYGPLFVFHDGPGELRERRAFKFVRIRLKRASPTDRFVVPERSEYFPVVVVVVH